MKRIFSTLFAFILCITLLSGCQKSEFSVIITKDNTALIDAKNAAKDYGGSAGSLTVPESGTIVVESTFEKAGEIRILFSESSLDAEATAEQIAEAVNMEDGALEITVSGSETKEYQLPPGEYLVNATVLKKVTGTITISTK